MFKANATFSELSKQQLIDCDLNNYGCNGGLEIISYQYVMRNGIALDSNYPYSDSQGRCSYTPRLSLSFVSDYNHFQMCSETEVMKTLNAIGPVTIAIDAKDYYFAMYKGGIYSTQTCDPNNPNHSMLLVGYGENSLGKYWIIKNRWVAIYFILFQ